MEIAAPLVASLPNASPKVALKVAQRRRQILDAAAELFSVQGYRAASMRQLAEQLGLSKASLYHYFASKEELLTLLYSEVIAENTAQMQAVTALGLPSTDTLREVLVQRIEHMAAKQRLMRVFYEEELELPPEVSAPMQREREEYERVLLHLVQRGLQEGVLRSSASAPITVNTLLGAVNWTYRWYKSGGELSARAFAESVVDTLLGGVMA